MGISKVILNGVTKVDLTSDTVEANKLLSGIKATGADGNSVTGNIASRSSTDLTASGATVTVPAGHYASQASKSVASGTAGTPTATKGTVSNHAVTVTPSVTNTAGYITGGTQTGTAVTVNVAELESGTKTITENGTGISVLGYSTVDVDVAGSGGGGTYTATILTRGVYDINWPAYCYVKYNNTKYYTANSTFQFTGGGTLAISLTPRNSGTNMVVVDGETVASTSGYNAIDYQYTLPEHDIKIMFKDHAIGISPTRSSYQLIAATQYTVNTTSTSEIAVGTFDTGDTSIWTSDKMVYVKIRRDSVTANGFVGTDCFFCNNVPGNGLSSTSNYLMHGTIYQRNSAGYLTQDRAIGHGSNAAASGYGVYPNRIYDDGKIDIKARYDSSITGTISGNYNVEVYLLDWPCGISPFYDGKAT